MSRCIKLAFLVIALSATGVVAYAATGNENDAPAVARAKIPLIQAITAAEQHVSGNATRAEFERGKKRWVYDVEVVRDNKTFDVKVDPETGAIIASTEDRIDHDDHRDRED